MLPKKILVATDGSEYSSVALQTACSLAEKISASIGLLYVVNIRQLEGPLISDLSGAVGAGPFLNFQKQVRDILYEKGETVLANYLELCRRRGIQAETQLAEGVVSKIICQAAKAYDLICLGRHGEHAAFRGLMMGSTVEEVVRGSVRPVLVSAGEPRDLNWFLVPYDGSRTASAALVLAVEMASGMNAALAVLNVSGDPVGGERCLEEARKFIEPRDLNVEYIHRAGDPVYSIVETAEKGFDLVIMGAYGHSRLRELFLGSTTAGVLNKVRIPLMLYR